MPHRSAASETQRGQVEAILVDDRAARIAGGDQRRAFLDRDSADLAWKPHGATGLVFDPSHRQFVGSHIRPRDLLSDIGDRRGKGPDQSLLDAQWHLGVGKDN